MEQILIAVFPFLNLLSEWRNKKMRTRLVEHAERRTNAEEGFWHRLKGKRDICR